MRSATSIILFSLSMGFSLADTQIPLFERLVGAGHVQVGQSNQTETIYQGDHQNFGKACRAESEASTCGDFFDGRVDHALFCSPVGVCAGRGAICGTDAACNTGLKCSDSSNRCVPSEEYIRNGRMERLNNRRKAAHFACPPTSEACATSDGRLHGFACVHTETDVQECGGCLKDGGLNCAQIANALATSCRQGTCLVHACTHGFSPSEDGHGCDLD